MKATAQSLLLVETNQCYQLAKKILADSSNPKNIVVICSNPKYKSSLQALGASVVLPKDLISSLDHKNAAKTVTFLVNQVEKKLEKLKGQLYGESSLFFILFQIQFLLGNAVLIALLMEKAKQQYPSIQQVINLGHFIRPSANTPLLQNNESFQSLLAQQIFSSPVDLDPLASPSSPSFLQHLLEKLEAYLIKFNLWLHPLDKAQSVLSAHNNNLFQAISKLMAQDPWLLKVSSSRESNLSKTLKSLFFNFLQLFFPKIARKIILKKFNKPYEKVIDLRVLSGANKIQRPDFLDFIEKDIFVFKWPRLDGQAFFQIDIWPKIKNGVLPTLLDHWRAFMAILPFLEKTPVHFFHLDNVGLPSYIGEASACLSFKSTLITHGSHPLHQDDFLDQEFYRHARALFISKHTYTAIQSKEALRFADKHITNSHKLLTGPIVWGKAQSATKNLKQHFFGTQDIKLVVHASTYKQRNSTRFLIYEGLDEYIEHINHLIMAVKELNQLRPGPKSKLLIKMRPNSELNKEELRQLLVASDDWQIDDQTPFVQVLPATDVLVSFSSTTIEEALCNNIPVILYGRSPIFQFIHNPKGAALLSCSKDNLVSGLSSMLYCDPSNRSGFQEYQVTPESDIFGRGIHRN